MPYTYEQCQVFAVLAKQGKKVPADWREHCWGVKKPTEKKSGKDRNK